MESEDAQEYLNQVERECKRREKLLAHLDGELELLARTLQELRVGRPSVYGSSLACIQQESHKRRLRAQLQKKQEERRGLEEDLRRARERLVVAREEVNSGQE